MIKANDKKLFNSFVKYMKAGIKTGSKEYGDYSYLKLDMLEMAEMEVRDLACYAFFVYSKLKQLEKNILKVKDIKELK